MELASWPTHIYIYRIIQQGLALCTKSCDVAFLYQILDIMTWYEMIALQVKLGILVHYRLQQGAHVFPFDF